MVNLWAEIVQNDCYKTLSCVVDVFSSTVIIVFMIVDKATGHVPRILQALTSISVIFDMNGQPLTSKVTPPGTKNNNYRRWVNI